MTRPYNKRRARRRQIPIGWNPAGQQPALEVGRRHPRHYPAAAELEVGHWGPALERETRRPGTISREDYDAAMGSPNAHFGRPGDSPMAEARQRRVDVSTDYFPGLAVGAPITEHDARAMARVLRQHGYSVGAPKRTHKKTKRKRRGGLLVGFVQALTGGRR